MISNVSSLRYWEWHCQRSQHQFTSESRGIRLMRVPITMKTKMSSSSGNRKIEWGSCGTAVTVWLSHLLGLPWGSSRDPRLQQQTFIFSQFWRPEVQDQAGGGAGFFWGVSLWLVNVTFCLCPHSIFPVCVPISSSCWRASCIGLRAIHAHVLEPQSCLTLCDSMHRSPPGASAHGMLLARILGVGCHTPLLGIFLAQGLNPSFLCLLHCKQVLYHSHHVESPRTTHMTSFTLNTYSKTLSPTTVTCWGPSG